MFFKPKRPKRLFNSWIFACFSAKARGRSGHKHVEEDSVDDYFVKNLPDSHHMVSDFDVRIVM